jgi:mannose-6-phosphate isomerase-like protein (cupin superfamily)
VDVVTSGRNDPATAPQRRARIMRRMTNLIHIPNSAQELAPGDALATDPSLNQLVRVTDGLVYVRRGDDDAVLFAGDALTIPAGEPRRVWNAGDEPARVIVAARLEVVARAA